MAAQALAPRLPCGTKSGSWERLQVRSFGAVSGFGAAATPNRVTAYALDSAKPSALLVTNGVSIQRSSSSGCGWSNSHDLSPQPSQGQPFLGTSSRIVAVGLAGGTALAAVQEGSGATSRPHVLVSVGGGSWATRDNGLPAQGAPQLLRTAGDGTAYLTISPTASGGPGGGTGGIIPGLPGGGSVPGTTTPSGLLYRTTDRGASWTLQSGAGDVPGTGSFDALAVDPASASTVYGLVDGRFVFSRDAGGTFTASGPTGLTSFVVTGPGQVIAFKPGSDQGYRSDTYGVDFESFPAVQGVVGAAARNGDSRLVVQTAGGLFLLEPTTGKAVPAPAGVAARRGTLLGDRGVKASYHALAGDRTLLRFVDPPVPGAPDLSVDVDQAGLKPPRAGTIAPASRVVSLNVGESEVEDFTLALPKNPTPLDLFFLIDASESMRDLIDDLRKGIEGITGAVTAKGIDLDVGVATLGTAPGKGEQPYPETGTYVYPPTDTQRFGTPYVKPKVYTRIRAVGPLSSTVQQAFDNVRVETTPPTSGRFGHAPREGQLLALEQAAVGNGYRTEQQDRLGIGYDVPRNQDARFRDAPGIRRVIVLATDEEFDAPYGTPVFRDSTPDNPHPDPARTIALLRREGILVFGLTAGDTASKADLQRIARGTGSLAPAGGVNCGGFGPEIIKAGAPLVCSQKVGYSDLVTSVIERLPDFQRVSVVPTQRSAVLGAISAAGLQRLDVTKPNAGRFSVRVSCIDVAPGRYTQQVQAVLRGTVVAKTTLTVSCVKAAAAVRPRPITVNPPPAPPAQPVVQPAAPPAAPPPAVQPQPQVQPQLQAQVQVQPLTAAAIQEQQELQLALAMAGTLHDDDPVFSQSGLAMVDRRKREEVQAFGVLAFAMVACSGLGLARLRQQRSAQAARVRR